MISLPPLGLSHEKTLTVEASLTVPGLPPVMGDFRGFPEVLATPYLISFAESVCIEAVAPHLAEGEMTLGTLVEFRHLAASPVGRRVRVRATLTAVEGRRWRFAIECRDGDTLAGAGAHERTVVDRGALLARLGSDGL